MNPPSVSPDLISQIVGYFDRWEEIQITPVCVTFTRSGKRIWEVATDEDIATGFYAGRINGRVYDLNSIDARLSAVTYQGEPLEEYLAPCLA